MSDFLLQSPDTDEAVRRPVVAVAVVMRRERMDNAWQPWRWALADVVPQEEGFGDKPRLLFKNDDEERWLHPGFKVELFPGDAEGYYLNVTTAQPCFWVVWRSNCSSAWVAIGPRQIMASSCATRKPIDIT